MGYGALIPLKSGDKTIIQLIIFDDELFNRSGSYYSPGEKYIENAAQYVDSIVPYLWYATAFPYNEIFDYVKQVYTNWFYWDNTSGNITGDWSLNGKIVTSLKYRNTFGYSSSIDTVGSNVTWQSNNGRGEGNVTRLVCFCLPESCLVDGAISIQSTEQPLTTITIDLDNHYLVNGNYTYRFSINFDKSSKVSYFFTQWENLNGYSPAFITNDPYSPGGDSNTGGGTGSFDGTGDNVDIPSLPTLSATDAGFITLFNPSLSELKNLSDYMWSDLFDIAGWRKIFSDPMQAILGLSIVPVDVPSSGSKTVSVGNISTGISMTVATSQYVEVDCGTLNVQEYWGAYLDYDPYTKAEIYLPYIGIHPLATDDIMNKPVHVVYHIDILSGACCAYVKCGGSVLYSFIGQCSSSIPITGDNWTNVINGAISIAGSIGSMVATGGASAPMSIGQIASTAVNTMKPSVEKSGAMSGTGGMLGVQTPYLILTRPRQALPRDQNAFMGYPSFITENLGSLSGYTEIDSIHLENVPATEQELSEIESLLKSGVIF